MWSRADALRASIALGVALVAITAAVWIDDGSLAAHVDDPVERWWVGAQGAGWTSFFSAATNLGAPLFMFTGGVVLGAVAFVRSRWLALAILVATLLRPLVSTGVKNLVDRPRPHLDPLVTAGGASYPSGHALAATVFWLAIPAVVAVWTSVRAACWSAVVAGLAVVVVMVSRMYLDVHWLTDVVAGTLFGLLLIAPAYAVRTIDR